MKNYFKILSWAFFLFALALMLPVRQAQAYLDPGTGSYMIQLIIAGVAGALISVKMFWRHIKYFFVRIFYKNKVKQPLEKENDNK
jgi:hypothetical protein